MLKARKYSFHECFSAEIRMKPKENSIPIYKEERFVYKYVDGFG